MSIQPYIDDPAVKVYIAEGIKPAYVEAGRALDDDFPIWSARAVYDHGVGNLSWAASCAKHLAECRAALGLTDMTPSPHPPSPVDPGAWPRRGLSYYTSATDPRVDPAAFATRLQDAGATLTRAWLFDAWAIGVTGGTGCYDGYLPWVRRADGRFDLWQVNPAYLDRLRAYVEAMNAHGVLPELSGLELYTWSNRKRGMLWVPDANRWCLRYNAQGVYYADDSAFERIGQPSGEDAFLGAFYKRVVQALDGLAWTVEIANEMPQKEMHVRLRDRWREGGYTGTFSVNRHEDTPSQYANMQIGTAYHRIAFHGRKELSYLDEVFEDGHAYKTFRDFFNSSSYDPKRIVLSSDGCRKSTDVNDAYDYDALRGVFSDGLHRWFSIEHQSRMKLRGFTEGRIDLNDLEVDWFESLT